MSGAVKEIQDADFEGEVIKSKLPVMVDFWASWCAPCKMMAPVVERLAKDFQGSAKVLKVNIDENAEWATKLGVMSIPTFIFFKDGKEVDRVIGVNAKEEFEKHLRNIIGD